MSPLVFALVLTLPSADAPSHGPVLVAAAADLQGAFTEIGKAFEAESGVAVSFTFGSTGLLAKQIKEGAPFDAFAAANVSFVDDVATAGSCDAKTKARYGRGRIAVWFKKDPKIAPPTSLADLSSPRFAHIAIANPAHAPYGVAAKEALVSAGVWDKVSKGVVLGENVRQTLQLAETGNADVAIVALSLAIPSTNGAWFLVDDKLHAPLDQALVVCTHGANQAGGDAFARYVASPKARAVLQRYGFALPGEAVPATSSPVPSPMLVPARP